jgi:hypothetical protein
MHSFPNEIGVKSVIKHAYSLIADANYILQDLHEKFNKYGKEEWDY